MATNVASKMFSASIFCIQYSYGHLDNGGFSFGLSLETFEDIFILGWSGFLQFYFPLSTLYLITLEILKIKFKSIWWGKWLPSRVISGILLFIQRLSFPVFQLLSLTYILISSLVQTKKIDF